MIRMLVIAVGLVLSGCAHTHSSPAEIKTITVDRPVVVVPPPPTIPTFISAVDELPPTASPGEVAKAYVQDTYALRSLVIMYRQVVDTYAKMASDHANTMQKLHDVQGTIDHVVIEGE